MGLSAAEPGPGAKARFRRAQLQCQSYRNYKNKALLLWQDTQLKKLGNTSSTVILLENQVLPSETF